MSERPRDRVRRLLLVLAVPLAFVALGAWQLQRGLGTVASYRGEHAGLIDQTARLEAIAAVTPMRVVTFEGDPEQYSAAVAARLIRGGIGLLQRDVWVAEARVGLAVAAILGAVVCLLAGAAGLAVAGRAGRRSLISRAALATAFGRVRAVLPAVLAAQVAGLTLATGAALLFEVAGAWFFEAVHQGEVQVIAIGLAIVGGVFWFGIVTLRQLRRSLAAFTPEPMPLLARAATRAEAPGLWRLVDERAAGLGIAPPENVAVGLLEGFFITGSDVLLGPAETVITGRTLHLPLPSLAMLDAAETGAVVAHELAHLAGEDTDYSKRFLPVYDGIGRNLAAIGVLQGHRGAQWTQAPAWTLGLHTMAVFDRAVNHWRRMREIEADAAGIAAGGARAAASALVRTSLIADRVAGVMAETLRAPGAAAPDLVAATLRRAETDGLPDPAAALAQEDAEIDARGELGSHPPTLRRVQALGVEPDDTLLAHAGRPVHAGDDAFARGLFLDWDAMCRAVSADAIGFATEQQSALRAHLQDAAALPFEDALPIHDDPRLAIAGWCAGGCVALLLFLGLTWVLLAAHTGKGDPTLPLIDAGLLAAAALAVWRIARLWRGARTPLLTLHADGLECRGLDRIVPWLGVETVSLAGGRRYHLTVRLKPNTPVPKRVTGHTVRVRGRWPAVMVGSMRARGYKPQAFVDLVARTWLAAQARAELDGLGGADPPYVAILSEEQLQAMMDDAPGPVLPDPRLS